MGLAEELCLTMDMDMDMDMVMDMGMGMGITWKTRNPKGLTAF